MDVQFLQLTRNQLNQLPLDTSLFKVGKILSAMVGESDYGFTLLLNNKAGAQNAIPIKTQLPLTKGEILNFKVTQTSDDTIVLKLQAPPQKLETIAPKTPEQLTIENAMRLAVPKQDSYAPLLSNLNQIRDLNPQQFQQSLKDLAANFIKTLPTVSQTTDPQGLKEAIKNSGIFLESKLAQAAKGNGEPQPQVQNDLKANLLKLYSTLLKQLDHGKTGKGKLHQELLVQGQLSQGKQNVIQQQTQQAQTLAQQATKNQSPLLNAGKPAMPVPPQINPQTHVPIHQQGSQGSQHSASPHYHNPYVAAAHAHENKQIPFPAKGQFPKPQKIQGPNIDLNNTENAQHKVTSQVEAALSRMQLNQIASLPTNDGAHMTWLLDVPIRTDSRTDIMQMAIEERDARDPDDPEGSKQWTINIAIDLETLGAMQASIQLYGKKIQVNVWAEDPDSHYLIQSELRDLDKELRKQGFEVEQLKSHPGLNNDIEIKNTLNLVDQKI